VSAIALVGYPAAGLQGRSQGWPHTLPPSRKREEIAEATIDMTIDTVITIITGTTDKPPLELTSNGFDRDQVSGSWRREDS